MNLLAPLGLLFGLLALPILALYMLKLRRKDVTVSSTLLWTALLRDRQANTPWQRLKRNLLLFLQLLILAALTLSLARPALLVRTVASGSMVLILDGSASMSAADVAPSRFAAARQAARDLAAGLQPGSRMTILLAANPPQVLANAEPDPQRLLAALAAAAPTQGGADWPQTFALAAGAAASAGPDTTTIILSDGGFSAVGGLPALPGQVRYLPFGAAANNLALRAFSARLAPDGSLELFASVHNYGPADQDALLSIDAGSQFLTARQLTVPAGADADLAIGGLAAAPGWFRAVISSPAGPDTPLDNLSLDNTAYALYNPPRPQSAWVLSQDMLQSGDENLFLYQMLNALAFTVSSPPYSDTITNTVFVQTAVPTSTVGLLVLDGAIPAVMQTSAWLEQSLAPGVGLLIINPPASIPGVLIARQPVSVTGEISLGADFLSDPLLSGIEWAPVYIARARPVTAPWAQTVVSASDLPLALRGELNGRRAAILSFDLHDSNLPLEVAYPILMSSLLDYLAPAQAVAPESTALQPGGSVEILPQPGVKQVAVGKPDGTFVIFDAWNGSIHFADTAGLGIYSVNLLGQPQAGSAANASDRPAEYFAVNLFDPGESDITPYKVVRIGTASLEAAAEGEISRREYWRWPAALALAALLLEWLLYHRRLRTPPQTASLPWPVPRAGIARSKPLAQLIIRLKERLRLP